MEEFHREIKMTGVEVKTVSNSFEGVSDSQFVENRVYDEEDVMICEVNSIVIIHFLYFMFIRLINF